MISTVRTTFLCWVKTDAQCVIAAWFTLCLSVSSILISGDSSLKKKKAKLCEFGVFLFSGGLVVFFSCLQHGILHNKKSGMLWGEDRETGTEVFLLLAESYSCLTLIWLWIRDLIKAWKLLYASKRSLLDKSLEI